MSKKYQPKPLTGREYVDSAQNFYSRVLFHCSRFPDAWKDYIVLPVIRIAEEIASATDLANQIYISEKHQSPELLIHGYEKRIEELQDVLRKFTEFNRNFERLLSYTNLYHDELRRIKSIIKNIIVNQSQMDVTFYLSEIDFKTPCGNAKMKLLFTERGKEEILRNEQETIHQIQSRIQMDQRKIQVLQNTLKQQIPKQVVQTQQQLLRKPIPQHPCYMNWQNQPQPIPHPMYDR